VDTQPLPVTKAHARASVCVCECARVRALLRRYGFHFILISNLRRCCHCASAHTCTAVHACPEVRMCVGVCALGRPRVHVTRAMDVTQDGAGLRGNWATPLQSDMSASAGSKLMLAGLLDYSKCLLSVCTSSGFGTSPSLPETACYHVPRAPNRYPSRY
jgi:hypothetical protein